MSWAVIGGAIASIASTIGSGAAAVGSGIGAAGSAIGSGAAGLFGSGAGAAGAGAAGAAGTMPGIFAAAPAAAEALTAGGAGMSFAPMASGAAAAAPAAATGGGLQGLLSGLFQSGASPTQLSGPGVASNAPVGAAAGEAAAPGGFDFGNWLTQVNPQQIATNFNKGGMAGQRDFRGLSATQAQEAQQANANKRTEIVQKQFESQQADQAKKDAANTAMAKIFEKPGALDAGNLPKSLAEMIPHLFASGNTAGASGVFNLLTKAQEDEKTNSAMGIAGYIAQKNTKPDGTFDWANARKELNTLGNPHVSKMFDTAIIPSLTAQRLEASAEDTSKSREANRAHQLKIEDFSARAAARGEAAQAETARHNAATEARLGTAMQMRQGLGPVPPAQLPEYIDKNGRNPQNDPNLNNQVVTHGDLVQSGYARVKAPVQAQLKQSNIALSQINRLEDLGNELFKGVQPGMNLANALKLRGQDVTASGKVREFNTLLLETLPSMAISSGLTPGRLGETVLEKIEKPMMPNSTDSFQTFKGKITQLKQRLNNNREVFFGEGAKGADFQGGGGTTPQGGPKAGDVVRGYKFKGGNPSDEKNWEKQKQEKQ